MDVFRRLRYHRLVIVHSLQITGECHIYFTMDHLKSGQFKETVLKKITDLQG